MDSHHFCQFLIKHLYHGKKKWRTITVNLMCLLNLYLFIFSCAGSSLLSGCTEGGCSLIAVCGLLITVASCRAQAPGHTGFSSCGTVGSGCVWGYRTTGSTASLYFTGLVAPLGIWDLPVDLGANPCLPLGISRQIPLYQQAIQW